ncbi:hypothetical protein BuS5_01678 [Desulfosarcina sp. BuS5]|uniref:methyltransferase family protein n=1 Tax=Desulfosarcina sp. BuS5 TaxID=933262 RepID=UPI0004891DB8|nr:isoprenylcysteine carboxylmethyltransferase family protein [Desulfosarcina sp. BuS5]WDN88710.1 hypothetical protein BuS5_01678 [Desulfosarcina sp. BuS5]
MSLRDKLINLFYQGATSSRKARTLLTPIGGFFFFIFVGLFILVSFQIDNILKLPQFLHNPLNVMISLPVLTVGLFLALWSILHFFRVKGTPVPFNPPSTLVKTGPYAHARNPMLTGVFILLLGLGTLLKSISLTFIFTPLFILLSVLELKAIEEPELEKRLGKEYLEYKKGTPMFVPWLRAKSKMTEVTKKYWSKN